jgi:hypothetical protein
MRWLKDKEFKLEGIKAPHTLGGSSCILFGYIDLAEVGIRLAELALRKPKNLSRNRE